LLSKVKLEIMTWEEGEKPRKVVQLGIKVSFEDRQSPFFSEKCRQKNKPRKKGG